MTDPKGTDPLSITLGVEEEFFLVDPATRDLLPDPDPRIFEYCDKNRGDHKVVAEFLRSQIETTSRVCTSVEDVRSALMETRRLVIDAASQHGAGVMAASTHPFAAWQHQVVTAGHRYEQFAMTYQQAVRELLVGGYAHPRRVRRRGQPRPGHDGDAAVSAAAPRALRFFSLQ